MQPQQSADAMSEASCQGTNRKPDPRLIGMRPIILKQNKLKLTVDRLSNYRTALQEIVDFKKGEPIENTIADDL